MRVMILWLRLGNVEICMDSAFGVAIATVNSVECPITYSTAISNEDKSKEFYDINEEKETHNNGITASPPIGPRQINFQQYENSAIKFASLMLLLHEKI